jgi:hypothetical protein
MHLAIEAYHYNFAACLAAHTESNIRVETRFSPAFSQLANEPDQYDELEGIIPLIRLPEDIASQTGEEHWQKVTRIIDPGCGKEGLLKNKLDYCSALENFFRNPNIGNHIVLHEVARTYAAKLSEHFYGSRRDWTAQQKFSLSLSGVLAEGKKNIAETGVAYVAGHILGAWAFPELPGSISAVGALSVLVKNQVTRFIRRRFVLRAHDYLEYVGADKVLYDVLPSNTMCTLPVDRKKTEVLLQRVATF